MQTIDAVRARHAGARIIVVVELRSNTMRMRRHGDALTAALQSADYAIVSGESAASNDDIVHINDSRRNPQRN